MREGLAFIYPAIENIKADMSAAAVLRELSHDGYIEARGSKRSIADVQTRGRAEVQFEKKDANGFYQLNLSFEDGFVYAIDLRITGNALALGDRQYMVDSFMDQQNISKAPGEHWAYNVKRWNVAYRTSLIPSKSDNAAILNIYVMDLRYMVTRDGGQPRQILSPE